jgi:hypothetical protein
VSINVHILLKKQGNKIIIAEDTYLHPGAFIFYIEQLETLDVKNKAQYRASSLLPFSITSRIKPLISSLELMVFC